MQPMLVYPGFHNLFVFLCIDARGRFRLWAVADLRVYSIAIPLSVDYAYLDIYLPDHDDGAATAQPPTNDCRQFLRSVLDFAL